MTSKPQEVFEVIGNNCDHVWAEYRSGTLAPVRVCMVCHHPDQEFVTDLIKEQGSRSWLAGLQEGRDIASRDASSESSEHPEERSRDERRSAQSLIVHFNDGSERIIHTHHPIIAEGGWTARKINGVEFLILGHGIPRQMIPLCNVKSFDISEELL